jgi:hypothetical protein
MSTNSKLPVNLILHLQYTTFVQQAENHLSALCSDTPPDTLSTAFEVACDGLAVLGLQYPKIVIDSVMVWRTSKREMSSEDGKKAAPDIIAAAKLSGVQSTSTGVFKVFLTLRF